MVGRDSPERLWRRSSYSSTQGECVEVLPERGRVLLRDSNWSQNSVLTFRYTAWCGFLAGLVDPGTGDS
ncbi:DUF397 domain-containing protein [Streptomyces sp. NBC_01314]|uniref:DUF397 domain-containing protein n=1 Tax=Streptomyces sp. NBC_01314 TaxID=2903821 RepID=UPI003084E6B9|nr:DUF397 domain-containing protein [Streptomyces sp. NBC_01314]